MEDHSLEWWKDAFKQARARIENAKPPPPLGSKENSYLVSKEEYDKLVKKGGVPK